ncbi:hypothetical protein L1277_000043 [Okibacterium sp. HSC-33S16]|uniref:hypothetical protein n=1 Tax=Okibacterium sp. HSC-33S16 TaxID=2910965 RepID=UPI00209ED8D4|nr:hypothetical protein [Okibacterium sp. HSC-33S16]MCP2029979.1 hypothetical protein [Okibacterium sp. HSC-33S16]
MAAFTPQRVLAVAAGYVLALGVIAWLIASVVGQPIAGTDVAGWLAPVMVVAAVAGWLVVLVRLPHEVRPVARFVLPALGAGAAFLLAALVLDGLGSGDPVKGPMLALAQLGYPTFYAAVVLALVATAVASMGTPPHRTASERPIV